MALLRIRQLPGKEGRYRAELRLQDDVPAFEANAREYARAALRDFEPYGDAAADMVQKTQQLLAEIEKALASS
jgi:hypothetical protein